jgi:hypothetical protein
LSFCEDHLVNIFSLLNRLTAVKNNRLEVVKELLKEEYDIDVNIQDRSGDTALILGMRSFLLFFDFYSLNIELFIYSGYE